MFRPQPCFVLLAVLAIVSTSGAQQIANPPQEPLRLLRTVSLPDIAGDFNVFAVDLQGNRLFVSADKHGTIELFDLRSGEHLRSIAGVREPHMLAYIARKNELWIGDAGAHAMVILDGSDYHELGRVALPSAPTAGLYVPETGKLYIQDDGIDAKLPYSTINVIDTASRVILQKIRIEDNNLEAMAVDDADHLYLNLRQSKRVGVVNLKTGEITSTFEVSGLNLNTPIALDASAGRLFIAGRKPGRFYVLDAKSGRAIFEEACVEIADYMIYDPALKRIYVTGSQGISIFSQVDSDHYKKISELPTNGGKISAYVPSLHRFFIVHPRTEIDKAGLLVYEVQP